MNKILNWTLGSFFRTLGRILVYLLIGYILFNFLNLSNIKIPNLFTILDVNADTTVKIYDVTLTSSNYAIVPNGTRIINISDDTIYGQYGTGEYPPSYYIGTFCTDSGDINSWTGTSMSATGGIGNTYPNTLTQINFFNTKFSCVFPNSSYSGGHIVYLYGFIDPIWSTSGTSASLMGRISYSQPNNINDYVNSSWALLSWSWSNEPISIDYSSNSIITQNQEIINQNNTIISNQNSNTQDIINNQNSNTDREIESQQVCDYIDKNSIVTDNKFLTNYGSLGDNSGYGITDYIKINTDVKMETLLKETSTGANYCFYNTNKSVISCNVNNNMSNNTMINVPDNTSYVRFTINKSLNLPQIKICKNGNQAIGDTLNDLGDKLTDSTPPSNLDSLNNSAGWLPAGPVDSILNLPLSFLTNLNTNLSKSCEPVNLPLPYINKNLPLPCVNSLYAEINGLPNWINTIGVIASAFILFGYLINLYKYIDDTLTFRENNYIDNWSGV